MTTQDLLAQSPRGNQRPAAITLSAQRHHAPPVTCGTCRSAEYLVFEQVKPVPRRGSAPAAWDVECWCGQCEEYQGFRTTTPPDMPHSILQRGYGTGGWPVGA
ncbi:hypothetical protein KRR55_17010 [Paeniglutamicibacter sp. ABSL32-1]|uniref:hypothetical protein n=1 Tax=Paeniglutamicibacter quisquiliarum TaxID=2849498 RepID=UPI001C2D31A3|nr:hypothetical protein [Paeniglutamicibacter quisquiliarum]MBV1780816.1 hypothetical protein [Paeniglutamicibacter quisquiliarum]